MQEQRAIAYSDSGARNSSSSLMHARREPCNLSLRYTRDTAIINTSTQPRPKIFARVYIRGCIDAPLHQRAFAPSARVHEPRVHPGAVRVSCCILPMVNVVLLPLPSPALPQPSFVSVAHAYPSCAPTSARQPFLLLPLSFSLQLDSRCTEVWILVGLAGASIVASLSAGNIGVDRSSCCWRSHCLVRELFISKVYDSIVCK